MYMRLVILLLKEYLFPIYNTFNTYFLFERLTRNRLLSAYKYNMHILC